MKYYDFLQYLNLNTFELRRLYFDMYMCLNIIKSFVTCNLSDSLKRHNKIGGLGDFVPQELKKFKNKLNFLCILVQICTEIYFIKAVLLIHHWKGRY